MYIFMLLASMKLSTSRVKNSDSGSLPVRGVSCVGTEANKALPIGKPRIIKTTVNVMLDCLIIAPSGKITSI
jgi:hypothetical protein